VRRPRELVVDEIPRGEPGLAVADDLQTFDLMARSQAAEPLGDHVDLPAFAGGRIKDVLVEPAARLGEFEAVPAVTCRFALFQRELMVPNQAEELRARVRDVRLEDGDLVAQQSIRLE